MCHILLHTTASSIQSTFEKPPINYSKFQYAIVYSNCTMKNKIPGHQIKASLSNLYR